MASVADVENNVDIEIEEEESEEEDGEEIVVQGSMQFTLVPKPDASTTSSLSAASVEVRPTSPSVRVEAPRPLVPLEDLVSATFRTPDGSVVYVIGTAHFSLESQAKVREVISRVKPNVIMLELCSSRVSLLRLDEETLLREAREINIRTVRNVVRNLGFVMGTMHLLLLSMSAEITRICGMAPGGEFRCAVAEAKKIPNCMVSLGDRPIDITVKRAFAALSLWHKIKFAFHVIFQSSSITKDDIDKCMETDAFQAIMEELAGKFPELSRVFIAERDAYLAHSLQVAVNSNFGPNGPFATQPKIVVGVVGLGHIEGIKKRFGAVQMEEVMAVLTVPKPSMLGKVVRLTFKAGVICLVVYSVKKFAPRPAFLSMEKLSPHLEKMNDSVRSLTKVDLSDVSRNLANRMTSAVDASRSFVQSYL